MPFLQLKNASVGVLIGMDAPEAHWVLEQRRGERGEPHADLTIFGWVLRGRKANAKGTNNVMYMTQREDEELIRHLQKLFNQKFGNLYVENAVVSNEDRKAVECAERTIERREGHYVVGLPWKVPSETVYASPHMAMKRLQQLALRMNRDDHFRQKYVVNMQRYIDEGFAEMTTDDQQSKPPQWILPHHAVINPEIRRN